jgi:hypothetical protein
MRATHPKRDYTTDLPFGVSSVVVPHLIHAGKGESTGRVSTQNNSLSDFALAAVAPPKLQNVLASSWENYFGVSFATVSPS